MWEVRRSLVLLAAAFFCLLLVSLIYTGGFESHVVRFNRWKKLQIAGWGRNHMEDQENLQIVLEKLVKGKNETQLEVMAGFTCHSDIHTDVCASNGPVRIDTLTMKVYTPFNQSMPQANRIILPYPKKEVKWVMRLVSSVQMLQGKPPPPCRYTHDVPALVFSTAGLGGNVFHDFSELIIPLFLTSRLFQSRLRFIVMDFNIRSMEKYKNIFSHLSSYEIINPAANVSVHCFPGVVAGLHYHGALTINNSSIPGGNSMRDFNQFLRESYNVKTQDLTLKKKPVLVLISRQHSRKFLNENEMVSMMKALSFDVVVLKPDMMANLDKVAEIMNSCSVLVGAHGAGLTNSLFLPQGAVMVQVVGLGQGGLSAWFFGEPSKEMPLSYLEYKIKPRESSLVSLYGKHHPIVVDPKSVSKRKGYGFAKAVYLDGQNFTINIARFRKTLIKALGLLGRLAPSV